MKAGRGTRGSASRFRWDLSLYRSWFADELLELNDAQGNGPCEHPFQGAYVLFGARIGFRQEKGFSISIENRNLLDQRYPSSVDVIADSRTNAKPEIFHPGDGRGFFAGDRRPRRALTPSGSNCSR